jgi:DNA-binding transcriptional ArsR family regulator
MRPIVRKYNQSSVKLAFYVTMIHQPKTMQEKRAVKFATDLMSKYGYGYTISTPVMELTKDLKEKGVKISHPTLMGYWRALERLGYAKKEMQARIWGVTYRLNRYAFNNLITPAQ